MTDEIQLEIEGVSIVALGRFNPAIFQPQWFAKHGLIRDEEADDSEVQIIHREAAIFSTPWFNLQVTDNRFGIDATDAAMTRALRDLVTNTFKILEHTPISAFGLNSNRHYRMPSEGDWHAFGDHFAPKETWRGVLSGPGMRSLTIQGSRENCEADRVQVKIEPSTQVKFGVYIQVNQHYSLTPKREAEDQNDQAVEPADIEAFLQPLQRSWDEFLTYSESVSRHLFGSCKQ